MMLRVFPLQGYQSLQYQKQYTVKPVCNDHLYIEIYRLWFIQ